MERKLISGFQIFNKLFILVVLVTLVMAPILREGWRNYNPLSTLALMPAIVVWGWLGNRIAWGVHPVYLDDKAVYWKEKGIDKTVPLTDIRLVKIADWKGTYAINLEYVDNEHHLLSLRFLLPGLLDSGPPKRELLLELQQVIQKAQPDFRISIPSWWRSL